MDGRALIQQRALWLMMSEDVYNIQAARGAQKRQPLLEKEKKGTKRKWRKRKTIELQLLTLARAGTTRDGLETTGNSICIKQCTSSSTWRCCSFCNDEMYACDLKRCLGYLNRHQDVCAIRKNAKS